MAVFKDGMARIAMANPNMATPFLNIEAVLSYISLSLPFHSFDWNIMMHLPMKVVIMEEYSKVNMANTQTLYEMNTRYMDRRKEPMDSDNASQVKNRMANSLVLFFHMAPIIKADKQNHAPSNEMYSAGNFDMISFTIGGLE